MSAFMSICVRWSITSVSVHRLIGWSVSGLNMSQFNQRISKPVAQRQEMVISPLALPYSLFDGSCYVSRAAAPEGGRSPVEYRGNLSIHTYVHPSERASIVTGKPELGSRRPELASRMP